MEPICLACNVDLTHKSKDRRVLVSAEDVLPMWKSILHKKFLEVADAELSQSQIDVLLGSAKTSGHGIICIKCANKYRRLKREILVLEENMTKVIRSGIINSTSTSATVTPARAGQKRTHIQNIQDHPPAKKMRLSFPSQCGSDTATISNSPSAIVSSSIIILHTS